MADASTREARKRAHFYFDQLYRNREERSYWYAELAKFMDLDTKETHIGMFDAAQCEAAAAFARNNLKARYRNGSTR